MAEIRLDKIVKRYENGFEAVKHISLEVRDGEFLVLVGPSRLWQVNDVKNDCGTRRNF